MDLGALILTPEPGVTARCIGANLKGVLYNNACTMMNRDALTIVLVQQPTTTPVQLFVYYNACRKM